jgi:hypothetical protein
VGENKGFFSERKICTPESLYGWLGKRQISSTLASRATAMREHDHPGALPERTGDGGGNTVPRKGRSKEGILLPAGISIRIKV